MNDDKIVLEEGEHMGIFIYPFACVRPLRGRFIILLLNRRLRSLRSLHQRLWIFAAFGDALASYKVERGDACLR